VVRLCGVPPAIEAGAHIAGEWTLRNAAMGDHEMTLWVDFVVKVGGREARALARFLENGLW
jgi:hypothetical protein